MNYEKKYKEALEIARKINSGEGVAAPPDWTSYEVIFPELKESKDDRIVRCLLNYFNHVRYNGLDLKGTDVDEVISWLEEQGKKSTIIDIDKMVMEYSQTKDDDFGLPVNCMIRAYRKGINDALSIALNIEKQGENNPTENIEIKFCEGDRVVSNQDGKVYIVGTAYYITGDNICLHDTDGNHLWTNRDDLIKNYHLWTIQDAKDGDVLVAKDDRPFIFTGEFDVQDDNPTAYCGINSSDKFITGMGSHWTFKDGIKPATKEQRDQLFQKMEKAGYEWDSEKKELKKIKPKKLDADKVIEWLKNTIKETVENCGTYRRTRLTQTRLTLPYNSIEDLINDFKEDFGI